MGRNGDAGCGRVGGVVAHAFLLRGAASDFCLISAAGVAFLRDADLVDFAAVAFVVRSAGLAAPALATPVFFSGATNLSRGVFFLSGAAAISAGCGPA